MSEQPPQPGMRTRGTGDSESRPPAARTAAAKTRAAEVRAGAMKAAAGSLARAGSQVSHPRQTVAAGGRRLQVALAVFVALAVGVGYSYMDKPAAATSTTGTAAPTDSPVKSNVVACPLVTGSSDASIAAYTPLNAAANKAAAATPSASASAGAGSSTASGNFAQVLMMGMTSPLLTFTQTGAIYTSTGQSGNIGSLSQGSAPFVGQAEGDFAPGFTATETLANSSANDEHGLAATPCTAPAANLWFLGTELGVDQQALLNMVDTDSISAQLNITGYNGSGPLSSTTMAAYQGLVVSAQSQYGGTLDLTQLNTAGASSSNSAGNPLAVDLSATSGRVSAALLASDGGTGRDFILPQQPATHLIIPGVPAPSNNPSTPMKLELMLLSPTADTGVTLKWIGHSTITPTVTVPQLNTGQVAQVNISSIPLAGEPAALEIDSTTGAPVIAEIKVTAEGGGDTAYLSPAPALTGESIVAANSAGSIVELTNKGAQAAQVRVTEEGGTSPVSQTVAVPAGTTVATTLQAPPGASTFAVSVTPSGGANSIYAARILTDGTGGISIQPMTTALEDVQVPPVRQDLSGTVPQS